jgi:hypothetical protein
MFFSGGIDNLMESMSAACAVTPSSSNKVGYTLYQENCIDWMDRQPGQCVHAIVTDPPYGFREYKAEEKSKLRARRGGVWRIPPSFDGCERSPVPRFTVLTPRDLMELKEFFLPPSPEEPTAFWFQAAICSSRAALCFRTLYICR